MDFERHVHVDWYLEVNKQSAAKRLALIRVLVPHDHRAEGKTQPTPKSCQAPKSAEIDTKPSSSVIYTIPKMCPLVSRHLIKYNQRERKPRKNPGLRSLTTVTPMNRLFCPQILDEIVQIWVKSFIMNILMNNFFVMNILRESTDRI